MKKLLSMAVPMIGLMLLIGCATGGVIMTPENPTEQALYDLYQRHRTGLIFTGSSAFTVRTGDTLAGISRELYGDGYFYPVILLASSNVVLDPDRILPGMELTVPDLQRNLNNARARASIKNFLMEMADFEDGRGRGATAAGIRARADAL